MYTLNESPQTVFSFADAEMGILSSNLIKVIEKVSGQPRLKRLYNKYIEDEMPACDFWIDALERLGINIRLNKEHKFSIPKTGSLLFVANHPYGVIDGIVLCSLLSQVRQDYRILTHRVLQAPAVKDKILPVFFDGTPAALKSNLKTRAEATSFLKSGGAIIIFPAGAISLSKKIVNSAFDAPWKTFAAKLALHPDTVTLPFFFEGKNSILFQIARKFSLTLGYALMFHETCRLKGTSIEVQMRAPLDSEHLKKIGSRADVTKYLRSRTYGFTY